MENLLMTILVGTGVALVVKAITATPTPLGIEPVGEPVAVPVIPVVPVLPITPVILNLVLTQTLTKMVTDGQGIVWGWDQVSHKIYRNTQEMVGNYAGDIRVVNGQVEVLGYDYQMQRVETSWWRWTGSTFTQVQSAIMPVNPIIPVGPIVPVVTPTPIPSGSVIFTLDYNKFATVESIGGTGQWSLWHVDQNTQRDGSKTLNIINDPLGQKGRVLEMRYVGPHEHPSCLVNGIIPNYQTDPHGFYDVYLKCVDGRNARLWLEGWPGVQTIIEEYDLLYMPIDPSQSWGPKFAKQHYWRGTTQNQTTVFTFEEDRYMRMSYYRDSVEQQAPTPNHNRVNTKDQRWHHVRAIFKNSDPGQNNGLQELWIDGLLQSSIYNIKDTGNKWNGIHNYRQGSDNLRRFEANWVVTRG